MEPVIINLGRGIIKSPKKEAKCRVFYYGESSIHAVNTESITTKELFEMLFGTGPNISDEPPWR